MCILNWLIILLRIIELDLWLLPLNTPPPPVFWSEEASRHGDSPWYPLIRNTWIPASVGSAGHLDLYLLTHIPCFGGAVSCPFFQQAVRLTPTHHPHPAGAEIITSVTDGERCRAQQLYFPSFASHHILLTMPWLHRKDNLSQSPLPACGAISHR